MADGSLQFDEPSHTYRKAGVRIPSVTQILAPLRGDLARINADVLRAAGERGTAVHKAVEYHEAGDLDRATLTEWVADRLQQWEEFKTQTGFVPAKIEHRVIHASGAYAGTADLFGHCKGVPWHLDIKTCPPHFCHALQLAAYVEAERSMVGAAGTTWQRYGLYLGESRYLLKAYRDPEDFVAWRAALALFQYRAARGV